MVELLVVITIIVLLVGILAPALSHAVYAAEMSKCGATLKNIATGALTYGVESRMSYPYRATIDRGTLKGCNVIAGGGQDDRPAIKEHIELKNLLDPLCGGIDLHPETTDPGQPLLGGTAVYSNYSLWFGMGYSPSSGGGGRMTRIGNPLTFTDTGGTTQSFKVIASDWDAFQVNTGEKCHAGHADHEGLTSRVVEQNQNNHVRSEWLSSVEWRRSPIDSNYVMEDGGVRRVEKVTYYETNVTDGTLPMGQQRMTRVPFFSDKGSDTTTDWVHIPNQG